MKPNVAVGLVCAMVTLLVGSLAVRVAMGAEGNVTRLVRMSETEPMAELARETDPGFAFVPPEGHYDGVYFYTVARDPLATGEERSRIDAAAYRYGHPGYGWMAAALTWGHDRWIPHALLFLGLIGMGGAAFCTALIASHLGRTPWAGLLIAANPGIVYALISLTSETMSVALLALGLLLWIRRRTWIAVVVLTALAFVKEPFVLVPAGIAAWTLVKSPEGPAARVRAALPMAVPFIALGGWFVYLRGRFSVWSFTAGPENLTWPLQGWAESLRTAADMTFGGFEAMQLGSTSLPLLLGVGLALGAGTAAALRLRSVFDMVLLFQVALIACVSWLVLLYPKDMLRNVAIPLALLPAVFAGPARSKDEVPADEQDGEYPKTRGEDRRDEGMRPEAIGETRHRPVQREDHQDEARHRHEGTAGEDENERHQQ